MRSIILISPSKNEIMRLYQQWNNKAQNVFKDYDKLNMVLAGERIYIDYLEDGKNDYEESELNQIDILKPVFYSISYSDKEMMKEFIQKSVFSKGSYIDNDFGEIIPLDEIQGDKVLKFIQ